MRKSTLGKAEVRQFQKEPGNVQMYRGRKPCGFIQEIPSTSEWSKNGGIKHRAENTFCGWLLKVLYITIDIMYKIDN